MPATNPERRFVLRLLIAPKFPVARLPIQAIARARFGPCEVRVLADELSELQVKPGLDRLFARVLVQPALHLLRSVLFTKRGYLFRVFSGETCRLFRAFPTCFLVFLSVREGRVCSGLQIDLPSNAPMSFLCSWSNFCLNGDSSGFFGLTSILIFAQVSIVSLISESGDQPTSFWGLTGSASEFSCESFFAKFVMVVMLIILKGFKVTGVNAILWLFQ